MSDPGNAPYQVGPGGEVIIPGNVGFYGGDPASQPSVEALTTTTNLTVQVTNLHASVSNMLAGLKSVSLFTG